MDSDKPVYARIKGAKVSLLSFSILSAVNYFLALIGSSFVFVLSAFIPQHLLAFGAYASEKIGSDRHFYLFAVLGGAFVIIMLLCSIASFKADSFIIPASLLFICDCIFMLIYVFINSDILFRNNLIGIMMNLLLHAICFLYVVLGLRSYSKKKKGSN